MKGLYITLAILVGTLIIGVANYASYYDYGNTMDVKVKKSYEKNQNILSNYSNKLAEMAQVPEMYKDDLKELYTEAMGGRYGKDGSKAMFQFLQEKNPTIDASMYTSIQQAMEAGRNKFENAQTILIDQKGEYEIAINGLWSGFWLGMTKFPQVPLDNYKIIKSSYSNKAFEDGVEDGIKL